MDRDVVHVFSAIVDADHRSNFEIPVDLGSAIDQEFKRYGILAFLHFHGESSRSDGGNFAGHRPALRCRVTKCAESPCTTGLRPAGDGETRREQNCQRKSSTEAHVCPFLKYTATVPPSDDSDGCKVARGLQEIL